jgi:ABC-type transport system involved in multi-copper enzyme maturation permease subunit
METAEAPDSSLVTRHSSPSPARAWCVLVAQSFQRHWRVRQMGWVAVGLLSVCLLVVGLITARPGGWGLPERNVRRGVTYIQYADQLLPDYRYRLQRYEDPPPGPTPRGVRRPHPAEIPHPLDPTRDALQSLILAIPAVVLRSEKFLGDFAFMTFSRWVMLVTYLLFILPLFTLSYASQAFGAEREERTLIWLLTRPMPRSAIYLAKFVGTLPWCLAFSLGGFVALCLAGGDQGRTALRLYWPAALAGTVAFAALFHLIGAVFRRPVVVGLVYVFFFEALVGALPGSLKLLSLTFYTRCLMYNEASAAGYPVEMLEVTGVVSDTTAWVVLLVAAVGLTGLGTWLFARGEHRDDT